MTKAFSARWGTDVLDRLDRRSEVTGENRSRLAERYVDEGTRMDEFPGIVFRDGPTGRRAALAIGPDVWQLVETMETMSTRGEEAIAVACEVLTLSEHWVRLGLRYYAAYKDEIDERVRDNLDGAEVAEAAWKREQAALA